MESSRTNQLTSVRYPFEFSIGTGQIVQDMMLQGIEQLQQSWLQNTSQLLENCRQWIEEGYDLQITYLSRYQQWLKANVPVQQQAGSAATEGVTKEVAEKAAVIPADTVPGEDDLTRIQGLGKVLQQRLREAGIISFRQIAAWSEADIARIESEVLGSRFTGRITRDQWQAQAEELIGGH